MSLWWLRINLICTCARMPSCCWEKFRLKSLFKDSWHSWSFQANVRTNRITHNSNRYWDIKLGISSSLLLRICVKKNLIRSSWQWDACFSVCAKFSSVKKMADRIDWAEKRNFEWNSDSNIWCNLTNGRKQKCCRNERVRLDFSLDLHEPKR